MELLLVFVWLIERLFIEPLWWISTYLASFIFPYEGDVNHFALAIVIALFIVTGIFYGGMLLLN